MNGYREIDIPATADQRELIEPYLMAGEELETAGFGGTRYGGKTWTGAKVISSRRLMYGFTRALALRTVMRSADLNLGEEIKKVLVTQFGLPVGNRRNSEIKYLTGEARFVFPNGSIIQLGYCKAPNDWEQHLGLQWDDIWFEQAEQFPEKAFSRLRGSNRPNNPKCPSRTLLTFNPGGIGSEWIARRIINKATRDRRTIFVKSSVRDCYATLERDPSYIPRSLLSITDPVLRSQWLDGDWDIQSGIFFRLLPKSFDFHGTVCSCNVPYWADWYAGVDWGYRDPFATLWAAHWEDEIGPHLHVAKEVYETQLDLDQQAEAAIEAEASLKKQYPRMHEITVRLADPSTSTPIEKTSDHQTYTKASVWRDHGFDTYPSPKYARSSRLQLIRYLIRTGILTIDEDCHCLLKELRAAVYKEGTEDIDQARCPDHALDCLGYIVSNVFGIDFSVEPEKEDRFSYLKEKS